MILHSSPCSFKKLCWRENHVCVSIIIFLVDPAPLWTAFDMRWWYGRVALYASQLHLRVNYFTSLWKRGEVGLVLGQTVVLWFRLDETIGLPSPCLSPAPKMLTSPLGMSSPMCQPPLTCHSLTHVIPPPLTCHLPSWMSPFLTCPLPHTCHLWFCCSVSKKP